MPISQTVFGSKDERKFFYAIHSTWSQQFNIWHNLPFSNVIDLDDNQENAYRSRLGRDLGFFFATSVDYVFCDRDDRPLLCIEFDGMKDGYSVGDKYYQGIPDEDRHRRLSLKLRIAKDFELPFYVLSYAHMKQISPHIRLAIVDGIVGEYVVQQELWEKHRRGEYRPTGMGITDFQKLSTEERTHCFQLWRTPEEYAQQLIHNPISRALYLNGHLFHPVIKASQQQEGMLRLDCTLYYYERNQESTKVALHADPFFMPDFSASCGVDGSLEANIATLIALDVAKQRGIVPRNLPWMVCHERQNAAGKSYLVVIPNQADPEAAKKFPPGTFLFFDAQFPSQNEPPPDNVQQVGQGRLYSVDLPDK